MYSYFSKLFYSAYEKIYFKKSKTILFFFNYKFIDLLIYNNHIYWKNIYEYKFWAARKLERYRTSSIYYDNRLLFVKNIKFVNYKTNFFKNNFFIFNFYNKTNNYIYSFILPYFLINLNYKSFSIYLLDLYKRTFGEGFFYLRGLFIIFFIDACVTDDEPLWEPIEWSLVQTWLLFIFIFAWIAENLITSRYGSYTGRDKRVWFAWYKSFWLIDLCYAISYGLAALFVIVPFYYELTYSLSFVFSWWNWYTRVFFFKFISIFTIIILIAHILQLNTRWLNWKKLIFFILIINFFLAYLLYTHFIMAFFGYFTDPLWYQKSRSVDYIQLSHEPLKWGWGPAKRDHFTYHKVTTVFWFKNDGPFAGAFLMIHIFFFFYYFFFIYLLSYSFEKGIYHERNNLHFHCFLYFFFKTILLFFFFYYIF